MASDDHTSSEIVALIRATDMRGRHALNVSEAALLINLYASVAVARAERDMLADAASEISSRKVIRIHDGSAA